MKNRKKILNFIFSITISIDLILVPFNSNLINTTETEFNIIKIETNIRSASLSAWKLYNKQNKAIGKKLAALGGAEKKEEKTNESYQFDDNLDDFFSTSFC